MKNITLFSQILQQISRNIFNKAVEKYQTDKHSKGINSWTYLTAMLFCHLSKAQSLREIINGLLSATGNLNHLGIQGKTPSRSSLSYINEHRDWRIFREFFFMLKENLQNKGYLGREKFKTIKRKIHMLDSTVISLCLKNYPDSTVAFVSLNLLHRTYINTTGNDSLKIYLQQFTTTTSQGDIVVYGKLLMAELDKTNYVAKLSNLLNTYSNSSLMDLIYFKKFKYYLFDQNSPDSARIISNQMLSLFPDSQLSQETKFMLGDDVLQKANEQAIASPLSYFWGNYPNPFNPVTTIKYSLPQTEKVNITVYDVLGSRLKELVNEEKEAGNYEIIFNASNLSSGCYFYRIVTKDFVKTMKMMVLK